MLGNKKRHRATKETSSTVIPASRPAAGPSWFSGLPWLRAFTRHVSVLPTIEATAASATATAATTTTRLSWLLGFLALPGHVPRLAAVEAVSATATATAAFPGLGAVSRHVTVLATVEAALAATAAASATAVASSAALLAPADSNRAAAYLVTIEIRDCLLGVLFLVEVDETEGAL